MLMSSLSRFLLLAFLCLGSIVPAFGVAPTLYLKYDGATTDSSGTGIVTVTPVGVTPTYSTDRFGVVNKAVVFAGSQSLRITTSDPSAVGNSNQALGLRNASGTNTSFTLASWVYFNNIGSGQGYSTIFGNDNSSTGTLHAGTGNANALAHFGFDGNDANGVTTSMVTGQWYHVAFVYNAATTEQRIYINGMPENVRTAVTNTIKAANLYIGNWGGTGVDASNDLKGRLDDTVVYNVAFDAGQVQALFNNVDPLNVPAAGTYSAPKLPGFPGTTGQWGVREIKGYSLSGFSYGTLVNADRIARNYPLNAGGVTAFDYFSPVINMRDADNGVSHYFGSDLNFGTNVVGVDDNNLLMIAKCAVRITVEDDYTFGFRGDDCSRLRVLGKQFASSTRLATGNNINPAHHGDGIYFIQGTGDSNTIGVVHLPVGDYNLELTYWEGGGGSSVEVFAARGAKTAVDSSFVLVGDTASGGLALVRDPDTLPQISAFTVNGGSTLFVQGGVPANFTLAWTTNGVPTSLSIDQGVGNATPIAGGSVVVAAPAVTTTYTMTAQNGADVATKSVTVYVNAPPIINSFTANKTSVTSGTAVTLSWATNGATGANALTLNPGSTNAVPTVTGVTAPTPWLIESVVALETFQLSAVSAP